MEFHQIRIGKEKECLVRDKLVDGEREVENELVIANCLNRSFQKLGLCNGQNVSAGNISRIEVREKFCFRTVTLKQLYHANDSQHYSTTISFQVQAHFERKFETCFH